MLRLSGHASVQDGGAFYDSGAGLLWNIGRILVASGQATFGVLPPAIVSPRALTPHVVDAYH